MATDARCGHAINPTTCHISCFSIQYIRAQDHAIGYQYVLVTMLQRKSVITIGKQTKISKKEVRPCQCGRAELQGLAEKSSLLQESSR
jgi:hypothetical protein